MKCIYYILLLLLVSCRCDKTGEIGFKFNKETSSAIEEYISKNGRYDSYLLFPSSFLFNDRKEYTGLLVGPMYKDVWDEDKVVSHFLVNGKNVYVMSDCSCFMRHETKIKYCKPDSVYIQYGDMAISDHTPIINFIKRSFLLYYRNKKLQINMKPDTLFIPKIRQSVNVIDDENY